MLGQINTGAPFLPSYEPKHGPRKLFKTAQAYADMILKRWNCEYLPQCNQRSNWSKDHVRNLKDGKLVCLVDDSVKLGEYKLGGFFEIFTGNNDFCEIIKGQNST